MEPYLQFLELQGYDPSTYLQQLGSSREGWSALVRYFGRQFPHNPAGVAQQFAAVVFPRANLRQKISEYFHYGPQRFWSEYFAARGLNLGSRSVFAAIILLLLFRKRYYPTVRSFQHVITATDMELVKQKIDLLPICAEPRLVSLIYLFWPHPSSYQMISHITDMQLDLLPGTEILVPDVRWPSPYWLLNRAAQENETRLLDLIRFPSNYLFQSGVQSVRIDADRAQRILEILHSQWFARERLHHSGLEFTLYIGTRLAELQQTEVQRIFRSSTEKGAGDGGGAGTCALAYSRVSDRSFSQPIAPRLS